MINKDFKKALIKIAKLFKRNNISWILIGTTSQNLQGMKKSPEDIDIIVKLKELKEIKNLLSDYSPSEFKQSKLGDVEIELEVNNIPVEIIGEADADKYFKNKEEFITLKQLKNMNIPCRNLEKELEMYKKLDRPEKVQELQEFLS